MTHCARWKMLWAKVGDFNKSLWLLSLNTTSVDPGVQRGECSHRGADRLQPERDERRTGADQAGSRRSSRKSMKSENHLYQVTKPIIHTVTTLYSYWNISVSLHVQYQSVKGSKSDKQSSLSFSSEVFQFIFLEIIFCHNIISSQ